jgi:uncharacterized membrane protein
LGEAALELGGIQTERDKQAADSYRDDSLLSLEGFGMGRFEDELLKGLGVSPKDVTDEARQAAKETEASVRSTGKSMMALGCGLTIATLLGFILLALVA